MWSTVIDGDYSQEVPQSRIDQIAESLSDVLTGREIVEDLFRRHRRFQSTDFSESISNLPTRIAIDNDSSDYCTIIDVFANDRRGLLYTIARVIYELGLSIVLAKISTHLDQVVDVFYLTDADGNKIEDDEQLQTIRATLAAEIEIFGRQGYKQFSP